MPAMRFRDPNGGDAVAVEQPDRSLCACVRRACHVLFAIALLSLALLGSLAGNGLPAPSTVLASLSSPFAGSVKMSDLRSMLPDLPDSASRGLQVAVGVWARTSSSLAEVWSGTPSADKEELQRLRLRVPVLEEQLTNIKIMQLEVSSLQQENSDLRRLHMIQSGSVSVMEAHLQACENRDTELAKAASASWPALVGEAAVAFFHPSAFVLRKTLGGHVYRNAISSAVKDLKTAQHLALAIVHQAAGTKTTLEAKIEELERENSRLQAELLAKDKALAGKDKALRGAKDELADERATSTKKIETLARELQALEAEAEEIVVVKARAAKLEAVVGELELKGRYALADKIRFEKRLVKCGREVEKLKARVTAATEAPVKVESLEKAVAEVLAKLAEQGQAMEQIQQHIHQFIEPARDAPQVHNVKSSLTGIVRTNATLSGNMTDDAALTGTVSDKSCVAGNVADDKVHVASALADCRRAKAYCDEQLESTTRRDRVHVLEMEMNEMRTPHLEFVQAKVECEEQLSSVQATANEYRDRLEVMEGELQAQWDELTNMYPVYENLQQERQAHGELHTELHKCHDRPEVVEREVQVLHNHHRNELIDLYSMLSEILEQARQAHGELAELRPAGTLGAEDSRIAELMDNYSVMRDAAEQALVTTRKILNGLKKAAAGRGPA